MLTTCCWVVFAYTLFTVERFHDAVDLDLSTYKYFMLTILFRNTSGRLLHPETRHRQLISMFSTA